MRTVKSHDDLVKELMKRPGFKEEYDALEKEYETYNAFIEARKNSGLTMKEIAQRMGIKKSDVSRLMSNLFNEKHSPSISTLRKFANAVECTLEINFVPLKRHPGKDAKQQ